MRFLCGHRDDDYNRKLFESLRFK